MIVVMPNGNPDQQAAVTLNLPTSQLNYRDPANANAYVRSLCEEIVPFIEKNFRAIPKPESRAIAGLSMGGGHTISASTLYPQLFDYICPLSATGNMTVEQAQALKKAGVKLYWIGCGSEDFLLKNVTEFRGYLDSKGYPYEYLETGGGHIWKCWRIYLSVFAKELFK